MSLLNFNMGDLELYDAHHDLCPHPHELGIYKTSIWNVIFGDPYLGDFISSPIQLDVKLFLHYGNHSTPWECPTPEYWNHKGVYFDNNGAISVKKVQFKKPSFSNQHCWYFFTLIDLNTNNILFCSRSFKVLARKPNRVRGMTRKITTDASRELPGEGWSVSALYILNAPHEVEDYNPGVPISHNPSPSTIEGLPIYDINEMDLYLNN
eukprot:gb/GECH01002521.1/.p1 GENE.gb/GECH01002521.1/~~gb/GECH01002521.1/.p1  ORF type:complete len:208 (+),score=31.12 gb/GECH01002521.1/:1-624(+)